MSTTIELTLSCINTQISFGDSKSLSRYFSSKSFPSTVCPAKTGVAPFNSLLAKKRKNSWQINKRIGYFNECLSFAFAIKVMRGFYNKF